MDFENIGYSWIAIVLPKCQSLSKNGLFFIDVSLMGWDWSVRFLMEFPHSYKKARSQQCSIETYTWICMLSHRVNCGYSNLIFVYKLKPWLYKQLFIGQNNE